MLYRLGLYEKAMPAGLTFEQMLSSAGQAGFDYMEISIDETCARQSRLDWSREQRTELHQALAKTGVPISSMCLSGHRKWPLGSHDADTRKQGMQMLRKAVDFSQEFGVRLIQLAGYDVYYEQGDADTRRWFVENLQTCVDYAAAHGVNLGFETMETPFMDTISKAMEYVNAIGSPYLGVYPDLGNLTNACELYGSGVAGEIRAGDTHLFAMHLKETVPGKYRDMDFATGRVDFAGGIREAYACGVRIFTAEFWHDGCTDWQDRLKRTNRFLRTKFQEAEIN